MSKKSALLDSSDEEQDEDVKKPTIKINPSYAKKYEERKKGEELTKRMQYIFYVISLY